MNERINEHLFHMGTKEKRTFAHVGITVSADVVILHGN